MMGSPHPDTTDRRLDPNERLVLVVEDEPPIRVLWRRYLSRWGYKVDEAENGLVALEMARAKRYDLVITDLAMPVMTGTELVHILKKEQPQLEIIATTGFGTIEVAVEMMKAGAHDFITKPISFKHAEQVILKCMVQAAARREADYLRQINQDLEELNRIKEKFIAITNHELRTPVGLIGNVAEVLAQELRGGPLEPLARMILRASGQLNEIVTQLHELSRSSSGTLALQYDRFNLLEMCQEISDEFELAIRERKHALTMAIAPELSLWGDRVKLKKVVRELLQNAIKFTDDGGRIQIVADGSQPGYMSISVTDTGIGICESEQDKIFELFYEIGETRYHKSSQTGFLGGGMGIGLAVVNDIVKAHKGTIKINSRKHEGSTFVVTLPQ